MPAVPGFNGTTGEPGFIRGGRNPGLPGKPPARRRGSKSSRFQGGMKDLAWNSEYDGRTGQLALGGIGKTGATAMLHGSAYGPQLIFAGYCPC